MKVLLTGATGQLGNAILEKVPNSVSILTPNREELDLSKKDQCREWIEKERPEFVIPGPRFA